ncbi:MAG: exodeoxyribonuclease VII small subunit [Anaerolineales bacterium]|nr:exodeoxyribonuclease VII small subunit [Anaerolineales bacterium]
MAKPKDKPESFESLFRELEATVAKLEAGDLSLDESLALFQRGMELAKKCGGMLDVAELRIKELVPHGEELVAEDFEEEEE